MKTDHPFRRFFGKMFRLAVALALCGAGVAYAFHKHIEVSPPPVSFRSDFVPLKVVMTDYIEADGGDKLFKIEGSAQLIVPLAGSEPELVGKCFKYVNLPRPVVDSLSLKIDNQAILTNNRGYFTSRQADSVRINELRAEAARRMAEIAGSEANVHEAMRLTTDALRQFYEKFDGYSCSVQWEGSR